MWNLQGTWSVRVIFWVIWDVNSGPLSDWREEGIQNLGKISVRISWSTVGAHLLVVGKASVHPENISLKTRRNSTLFTGGMWMKSTCQLCAGRCPWIWRERGFLTQKGTAILNASFISELLHEAQLPRQAAVIHCQGYQQRSSVSFYNSIADHEAKWQAASVSPVFTMDQIDEPHIRTLFSYLHSLFHPSAKVLKTFLQNFIELTKDNVIYLNNLTQTCAICQQTNPNSNLRPLLSPPTKFTDIFLHKTGRQISPTCHCKKG